MRDDDLLRVELEVKMEEREWFEAIKYFMNKIIWSAKT